MCYVDVSYGLIAVFVSLCAQIGHFRIFWLAVCHISEGADGSQLHDQGGACFAVSASIGTTRACTFPNRASVSIAPERPEGCRRSAVRRSLRIQINNGTGFRADQSERNYWWRQSKHTEIAVQANAALGTRIFALIGQEYCRMQTRMKSYCDPGIMYPHHPAP